MGRPCTSRQPRPRARERLSQRQPLDDSGAEPEEREVDERRDDELVDRHALCGREAARERGDHPEQYWRLQNAAKEGLARHERDAAPSIVRLRLAPAVASEGLCGPCAVAGLVAERKRFNGPYRDRRSVWAIIANHCATASPANASEAAVATRVSSGWLVRA